MSFFKDVVTGVSDMEQSVLGPNYEYYKFIKSPNEMGMSGDGNFDALKSDVAGIINYVNLLVSGHTPASTTGGPLGSKYFIKTGGTCKDYRSGDVVTRSMYINNVPTGKINFIPMMPSIDVGSSMQGIVPGTLNNLGDINPVAMFGAFMEGNEPLCANVKLETIKQGDSGGRAINVTGEESGYVPLYELKQAEENGNVPKGTFNSRMNRALNSSVEGFQGFCEKAINGNIEVDENKPLSLKSTLSSKWFGYGFSVLAMYLLYKLIHKIED